MSVEKKYQRVRKITESLCEPLSVEDYLPQLVEYASPPKWHLAHTSWFFEEMILKKYFDGYREFDERFAYLFNSYYNSVGERIARASRGTITNPGVDEVYRYRKHVDKHMCALLQKLPDLKAESLTVLGINHEQQHQELLLTDLKYTLGHDPSFPIYAENADELDDGNSGSGFVSIDEGLYAIGHYGDKFHFDNECSRHRVFLHSYQIAKNLVTNGDYIEFIEGGGYDNFNHWLDDAWHYIKQHGIDSPLYWHKKDGTWHYFTLGGLKPVNPDAILSHVSYYEANAFANWKGMRLPTEFEWEVASEEFDWGKRWEWTNSAYLPYPDYKISEGAVGEYNGKFMVNQMVLRGASVATPEGHSRKTYRNFFHPHLQWQYSGIRLAQ